MEAYERTPEEDPGYEINVAVANFLEFYRKQKVNDRKRLHESGGIYCIVPGCFAKRASSGKSGYYRDCDAHHRGKRGKTKYTEGVWREWDE